MNDYAIDLNLDMDWILADPNYFDNLIVKPNLWNHYYLPPENLSKEFLSWADSLNLFIWYSEIFYTEPHGSLFIHSDHLDPLDSCKINWVYDNGPTFMRWFKVKDGAELKLQENTIGGFYYACDNDDDYELAYSHRVKKGTLLNVAIPHDVINDTDYPRWAVSIVFQRKGDEKRIGFNDMKELIKPWIAST